MRSETERVEAYLRRTYAAERRKLIDNSKFTAVGIVSTILDLALFNYLHFGTPKFTVLSAKAISTFVGASCSYIMDRKWAFRDRQQIEIVRDFLLFLFFNSIALCIQLLCLAAARYGFHLTSVIALNSAQLAGAAIGMLFRYVTYRQWVFPALTAGVPKDNRANRAD